MKNYEFSAKLEEGVGVSPSFYSAAFFNAVMAAFTSLCNAWTSLLNCLEEEICCLLRLGSLKLWESEMTAWVATAMLSAKALILFSMIV